MELFKIDWVELNYVLHQLREGRLSEKTLTQRICRSKDNKDLYFTLKNAQILYTLEKKGS